MMGQYLRFYDPANSSVLVVRLSQERAAYLMEPWRRRWTASFLPDGINPLSLSRSSTSYYQFRAPISVICITFQQPVSPVKTQDTAPDWDTWLLIPCCELRPGRQENEASRIERERKSKEGNKASTPQGEKEGWFTDRSSVQNSSSILHCVCYRKGNTELSNSSSKDDKSLTKHQLQGRLLMSRANK